MSERSEMPCWEFVKEDSSCSFHICVDCLVYLAKHGESGFSGDKLRSILRQRKKNAVKGFKSTSLQALMCPVAIHAKSAVQHMKIN